MGSYKIAKKAYNVNWNALSAKLSKTGCIPVHYAKRYRICATLTVV